jgi:hypothetical protein
MEISQVKDVLKHHLQIVKYLTENNLKKIDLVSELYAIILN